MTRGWPAALIGALWLVWATYWLIASRSVKPVRERQSTAARLAHVLALGIVGLLLLIRRWPDPLSMRVISGGWTRYWCAVALVVVGLGFAAWARMALGTNWSGWVTVKVEHELVRRGPYRRIRHPIYSGVLLAILGTGLAAGQVRGLLAFAIACVALWLKSRMEERWMQQEFGEQYAAYRASSWALIPFVL
jgi:protein-S-isoprenylcysteine O-methyltransferase Ste14